MINQKSKNLNTNLIIFLKETNIKIIDNFLKKEDLEKLNSLALSSIKDNEIKVFIIVLIKIKILKILVFQLKP